MLYKHNDPPLYPRPIRSGNIIKRKGVRPSSSGTSTLSQPDYSLPLIATTKTEENPYLGIYLLMVDFDKHRLLVTQRPTPNPSHKGRGLNTRWRAFALHLLELLPCLKRDYSLPSPAKTEENPYLLYFQRQVFKSILSSLLKTTPSSINNAFCSSYPCPGFKDILPLLFTTRCQGSFSVFEEECKMRTTCLAAKRFPASSAICP